MRRLGQLFMLMGIATNIGCTIELPGWISITHEDGTHGEGGEANPLPAPENPIGNSEVLNTDEQTRKAETEAYIAKVIYQGRAIEKSVQGPSGTIYDYVRLPEADILPPDISGLLPPEPADGLMLGMTEVQRYAELWGPAGATVFTRPDFSKYIMEPDGATSVQDWLDNHVIPGIPDDPYRLYSGLNIPVPNRGIHARVNAFKPEVEKDTFSVIELAVGCPAEGSAEEMIGVLIGADWKNYQMAPTLDFTVERWRYVNGKREGGYGYAGGFDKLPVRPLDVGAALDQFSMIGGEQWEHALMLIMAPNGDWWVFYNFQAVGMFPAALFTTLNQGACRAQVYGEVYNSHPENGWVKSEMGSGRFGSTAGNDVAWVRQIRYFDIDGPFIYEPTKDDFAFWSKPYHTPCYDRSALTYQGSAGPIMYLGGPGGKNPVCAQKKPSP
ncbi:MAG TPA: neprosin family prolyl endopeptidase [Polyangium sp.]|nr:neprosin family prolyl endopeptidase [Polyangium sp.]